MKWNHNLLNAIFFLGLLLLVSSRAIAYEIRSSGSFSNQWNSGGINDVLNNSQPQIKNILNGLSGNHNTSTPGAAPVGSLFNFKNFSSGDIGGIIKSVFGLFIKILATIVTVTIEALKGIIGAVKK